MLLLLLSMENQRRSQVNFTRRSESTSRTWQKPAMRCNARSRWRWTGSQTRGRTGPLKDHDLNHEEANIQYIGKQKGRQGIPRILQRLCRDWAHAVGLPQKARAEFRQGLWVWQRSQRRWIRRQRVQQRIGRRWQGRHAEELLRVWVYGA